ncbi:type II restriction endonuclease [Photobacterium leiognathi]|uniref:type II restriction endonuclease n=1 Tax=Photobacterium leiognathi TaxID=553611 RepID=UPI00298109C6|nr:type II restriction endonuclease [Photobacterium leiognathi]
MSIKPVALETSSLKTLTAVEAEANRSNQHELQGVNTLKSIFGVNRQTFPATFSLRGSDKAYNVDLTWYDAREGNPSRSPEYRLYFQSNPVMDNAKAGDDLLVGVTKSGNIHCELIPR